MGLVSVYNASEETYLFDLLREFASKVVYPRRAEKTNICQKYEKEHNIFGVLDVVVEEDSREAIYEISMPDHYLNFITYLLEKSRV